VLVFAALRIAEGILMGGGLVAFEGAAGSWMWCFRLFRRLAEKHNIKRLSLDMCAYGLKSPEGDLLRRPTEVWTNCEALFPLVRTCPGESSSHHHGPGLSGNVRLHGRSISRASLASTYAPGFVTAYADLLSNGLLLLSTSAAGSSSSSAPGLGSPEARAPG
jgi:hypothetical protein